MRNTVLVVDDVEINRDILVEMLEDEYKVLQAANGLEALKLIEEHENEIRIILLDLIMPELDGYEVMDRMRKKGLLENIPVLVITGETSDDVQKKCLDAGAVDFVTKPFTPSIVKMRVKNTIDLYDTKNHLEQRVEEQLLEIRQKNETLKNIAYSVINLIGVVVEHRDENSGDHVARVQEYSRMLADAVMRNFPEYGLTPYDCEQISITSMLHDTGKIEIPDAILCKPGKLTDEEYEVMKSHSEKGYNIISGLQGVWDDSFKKLSLDITRYHHERWDGRGYPDKLVGDEIPISAQIVGMADVYDALVNERPYKKPFSHEKAIQMICDGECGTFNPKLIECLKEINEDMRMVQYAGIN